MAEIKLSDLVVNKNKKDSILSDLTVSDLPIDWSVNSDTPSFSQRIFNCDEIIERLLATLRRRQEDSKTPINKLEKTKKFHEYCEKSKELLREISIEGERDETKIVVLREFFDIPECVWRLL